MKAKEVGDKLLPAFNTPTGIPWAVVNFARYDLMNKAEIIMLVSSLLCFRLIKLLVYMELDLHSFKHLQHGLAFHQ